MADCCRGSCSICFENYADSEGHVPRILACGHTLCEGCITGLIRSKVPPTNVKCPTCRTDTAVPNGDVKKLPKNFAVIELLKPSTIDSPQPKYLTSSSKLKKGEIARPPCESCGTNLADVHCTSCDGKFCHACSDTLHASNPVLRRHKPLDLEIASVHLCQEHSDSIRYYCINDHTLLCRDCVLIGGHKTHDYLPVKLAAADARDQMAKTLASLAERRTPAEHTMQEVKNLIMRVETTGQAIFEDVVVAFRRAHQALDQREAFLKSELDRIVADKKRALEQQRDAIAGLIEMLDRASSQQTELTNIDDVLILQMKREFESLIEETATVSRIEHTTATIDDKIRCILPVDQLIGEINAFGTVSAAAPLPTTARDAEWLAAATSANYPLAYTVTNNGRTATKVHQDTIITILREKTLRTSGRHCFRLRIDQKRDNDANDGIGFVNEDYAFSLCWLGCNGAMCLQPDGVILVDGLRQHQRLPALQKGSLVGLVIDLDTSMVDVEVDGKRATVHWPRCGRVYLAMCFRKVGSSVSLV